MLMQDSPRGPRRSRLPPNNPLGNRRSQDGEVVLQPPGWKLLRAKQSLDALSLDSGASALAP